MAKKFQFRLQGLLKVREFKEKKLKIELGALMNEAHDVREHIKKLHSDIDLSYQSQEEVAAGGTDSEMLQFYSKFIFAKREDIKNQENLLHSLEKKIKHKRDELANARGEVKVIDNLKEKEKKDFYREQDKKIQADIEDILQMRRVGKNERER